MENRLDPETTLQLLLTLLRGAAYFFAGFVLLALFTYVVFLCLEIFSTRPRMKTKIAKLPPQVGCASVVEQNHDLVFPETPISVAPKRPAEEAVRVTAPLHGAQIPMTVPVNLEGEPTWP
jgi:hypothetical protein